MTNHHSLQLPASVVTPPKVLPGSSVRIDSTMGASNMNNSNAESFHTMTESPKVKHSQHESTRVFRCLSNTTAGTHSLSAVSPDRRSLALSSQHQQQQRSTLKQMFQPPASSSCKKPCSPAQQVREAMAKSRVVPFLGCRLDRSSIIQLPLRRCKPCRADALVNSNTNTSSSSAEGDHKRVQFKPLVTVVLVPSHREYSPVVKKTLWGSMKEIKAAAIRNTAEFIHDRCNWRKATEEDSMYRDSRNGVLIHPVHVQRYYAAMQAHQEKKKQRQEQQDNATQQRQESEDEEENEVNSNLSQVSRKRSRCCSPSPSRRPHDPTSPDYERHEAKRRRLHLHAPVPCRPVYYHQQPQSFFPTQQENYCHYQQYSQHYNARMYPIPFPHHPSVTFPAIDTA